MNLKYQYQAQAGLQHVVSPQNSPLQYVSLHVPWALLSGGVSLFVLPKLGWTSIAFRRLAQRGMGDKR